MLLAPVALLLLSVAALPDDPPPSAPAGASAPNAREVDVEATDGGFRVEGTGEALALVPPSLEVDSPAPYPEALREALITGEVQLELRVNAEGAVEGVQLVEGVHPLLDAAAVEAARSLRFKPATLDGQPTAVRVPFTYRFEAPPPPVPATPGATLLGQVRSKGNRRPVPGARVEAAVAGGTRVVADADPEGRFTLTLPPGRHAVEVRAPGYATRAFTEDLQAGQELTVRYALEPLVLNPYETVVRGERERTEVSRVSLRHQELRETPGTMGDPFRVVMLMPGVASIASGISYPVVRGSQPAATGYFVDGVRVPALFHLALGPSVIHPDFIEGLDFYPGAPPARLGRLMGGAVEGLVSRPREEGLRASVYADLINAGAFVEGALKETGTSVTAAGRFSYSACLLSRLAGAAQGGPPEADAPKPVADFADYQLRVEQRAGPGRLRLLAFGSSDVLGARTEQSVSALGMSIFHRADLRWRQPLGGGELEAGATLGTQKVGLELLEARERAADYLVRENTLSGRLLWTAPLLPSLDLTVGADVQHTRAASSLFTGTVLAQMPDAEGADFRRSRAWGTSVGLHAQGLWRPAERWQLVPGLRLDSYHLQGGPTHVAVEPRLSARHQLTDTVTLKGGAALMHQPPTVLLQLPLVDVAGLGYGLQQGGTLDVGAEWAPLSGLEVGVDAYGTLLTRAVEFDPMDVVRDRRSAVAGVDPGRRGRAWGVELMVRHPMGNNWFGWLAYSYQRSERYERFLRLGDDLSILGIDEGWLPFAFEQQHVVNGALSYQLPGNWSLGATVHFNTGRPESGRVSSRTHRIVRDEASGHELWVVQDRDRVDRLPPFFRVDARISKRWTFDSWALEAYLDVMNASLSTEVYGFNYLLVPTEPSGPDTAPAPLLPRKESFGAPVILPMLGLKGTY